MKSVLTKVIKWSAIAALITGALLRSASDYVLLSQFVVVASALVVLTQAATMRRYIWMSLFLVVAALFNPVISIPFSNYVFGIVSCFALLLFFFSLELLKPHPRLSIASIADRLPGSKSL